MNPKLFSRFMSLFLAISLGLTACGPSTTPTATPVEEPQPSATLETQIGPTATLSSASTVEAVIQETATQGSVPVCTILQDLNLRFGPGTAYRPPVVVLPENTVVTPLGFTSQGIPGGSWVYVQDLATQQSGWVSAGSQYVSCDVELATLPAVAFGTPPPPPLPKSTVTSTPEGNCGFDYECDVIFSDESFVQFRVMKDGKELTQDDGVEQVTFTVKTLDDTVLYTITEFTSAYCIFGGNGPCNPWVVEDYVYKWEAGGTVVQPGEYNVAIEATVNGDSLRWSANFKFELP